MSHPSKTYSLHHRLKDQKVTARLAPNFISPSKTYSLQHRLKEPQVTGRSARNFSETPKYEKKILRQFGLYINDN